MSYQHEAHLQQAVSSLREARRAWSLSTTVDKQTKAAVLAEIGSLQDRILKLFVEMGKENEVSSD